MFLILRRGRNAICMDNGILKPLKHWFLNNLIDIHLQQILLPDVRRMLFMGSMSEGLYRDFSEDAAAQHTHALCTGFTGTE